MSEDTPAQSTRRTRLRIWQQNVDKANTAQQDLLQSIHRYHADIVCVQEPVVHFSTATVINYRWTLVWPPTHTKEGARSRSLILVNENIPSNSWNIISIPSPDVIAIRYDSTDAYIEIFNIYNDQDHDEAIKAVQQYMRDRAARAPHLGGDRKPTYFIILGDFNRHHPLWDDPAHTQLFSSQNLDAAEALLDFVAQYDLQMALPAARPTLRTAVNTFTRPDNVFISPALVDFLISCSTIPDRQPPGTLHFPIRTDLDISKIHAEQATRHNVRATDWKAFRERLTEKLADLPAAKEIETEEEFYRCLNALTEALQATIKDIVPVSKTSPFSKRWWNSNLDRLRQETKAAGRRSYTHRRLRDHPTHEAYRIKRNEYADCIKKTKKSFWEAWLEELKDGDIWTAHKVVSNPGMFAGRTRVPDLRYRVDGEERVAVANADNAQAFCSTFLPQDNEATQMFDDYTYPPPKFEYQPITNAQLARAIRRLQPYKAPGADNIPNAVLVQAADLVVLSRPG